MKYILLSFAFLLPFISLAATGDFVPLVTLPNVDYAGNDLTAYVNQLLQLVIGVAAMLAVIRIVTGGFQYMTAEAIGAKSGARETIQGAVFGLILLLGSWLILYTINPQILDLSVLKFDALKTSTGAQNRIDIDAQTKKAIDEKAKKFGEGGVYSPALGQTVNYADVTQSSPYEKSALIQACSEAGGRTSIKREITCRNKKTKVENTPIIGGVTCNIVTEELVRERQILQCLK